MVSHLLYADNALLFYGADQEQLAHLSWLLMWFEIISGLRINLNKSEIISIGSIAEVESLALELGCKVGALPSSYLGLPLGALITQLRFGMELKKGLGRDWLCGRDNISLKMGGSLLSIVLCRAYPYTLSLFRLPRLVRLHLEQIQRDFLWGGGNLEKKPHLVKWSTVCSNKKIRGLGVKSLSILNKALLCKWI